VAIAIAGRGISSEHGYKPALVSLLKEQGQGPRKSASSNQRRWPSGCCFHLPDHAARGHGGEESPMGVSFPHSDRLDFPTKHDRVDEGASRAPDAGPPTGCMADYAWDAAVCCHLPPFANSGPSTESSDGGLRPAFFNEHRAGNRPPCCGSGPGTRSACRLTEAPEKGKHPGLYLDACGPGLRKRWLDMMACPSLQHGRTLFQPREVCARECRVTPPSPPHRAFGYRRDWVVHVKRPGASMADVDYGYVGKDHPAPHLPLTRAATRIRRVCQESRGCGGPDFAPESRGTAAGGLFGPLMRSHPRPCL